MKLMSFYHIPQETPSYYNMTPLIFIRMLLEDIIYAFDFGLTFFIKKRKIIGLGFKVGYCYLIFKIKAEINNIAYIKVNSSKKKKERAVS